MPRLFDTHHIRKCKELEGMWEFAPVAGIGSDQPVTLTSRLFPVAGRCTHASETIGSWRIPQDHLAVSKTNLRIEFKGSATRHMFISTGNWQSVIITHIPPLTWSSRKFKPVNMNCWCMWIIPLTRNRPFMFLMITIRTAALFGRLPWRR